MSVQSAREVAIVATSSPSVPVVTVATSTPLKAKVVGHIALPDAPKKEEVTFTVVKMVEFLDAEFKELGIEEVESFQLKRSSKGEIEDTLLRILHGDMEGGRYSMKEEARELLPAKYQTSKWYKIDHFTVKVDGEKTFRVERKKWEPPASTKAPRPELARLLFRREPQKRVGNGSVSSAARKSELKALAKAKATSRQPSPTPQEANAIGLGKKKGKDKKKA